MLVSLLKLASHALTTTVAVGSICSVLAYRHRAAIVRSVLTSPRLADRRLRLMTSLLEWLLGQPARITDVHFTSNSIVLLGLEVPNLAREGVTWSSPSFATVELLEVGMVSDGLHGVLGLLGSCALPVCGIDLALGGARHLRRLRLHGVCVYPEEAEDGSESNVTLFCQRLADEVVEEEAAEEGAESAEAASAEDATTEDASCTAADNYAQRLPKVPLPPPPASPRDSSAASASTSSSSSLRLLGSSSFFRGVKEAMLREGLSWACGDSLSRALMQASASGAPPECS